MDIDRLKALFDGAKDKRAEAEAIGTTYQTMYNILVKGSTLKVDLLEKIAKYYKVPVGYFFDDQQEEKNNTEKEMKIVRLEAEVRILKEVIKMIKNP
jgi:transcriptional regulator with XRE-family HTH domain